MEKSTNWKRGWSKNKDFWNSLHGFELWSPISFVTFLNSKTLDNNNEVKLWHFFYSAWCTITIFGDAMIHHSKNNCCLEDKEGKREWAANKQYFGFSW